MIELKSWQFVLFLYEFFPRSNLNFFYLDFFVVLTCSLSYHTLGQAFLCAPQKNSRASKLKKSETQENNSKLKQKP